jgi:hypothetical protein
VEAQAKQLRDVYAQLEHSQKARDDLKVGALFPSLFFSVCLCVNLNLLCVGMVSFPISARRMPQPHQHKQMWLTQVRLNPTLPCAAPCLQSIRARCAGARSGGGAAASRARRRGTGTRSAHSPRRDAPASVFRSGALCAAAARDGAANAGGRARADKRVAALSQGNERSAWLHGGAQLP